MLLVSMASTYDQEAGMTAESTVKARVSLYNLDDGGYQIGVVLEVHIDGISETSQKFAEDAHEFCLILQSN